MVVISHGADVGFVYDHQLRNLNSYFGFTTSSAVIARVGVDVELATVEEAN